MMPFSSLHYLDALRPVLRLLSLSALGLTAALTSLAVLGVTLPGHEPLLLTSLAVGLHGVFCLCALRARHGLGDWGRDLGFGLTLAGLYAAALSVLLTLFIVWTGWRPGAFFGGLWTLSTNLSMTAAALSLTYAIPVHVPRLVLLQKLTAAALAAQASLCGLLVLFGASSSTPWRLNAALLILGLGGLAGLRLATGPLPPDDAPPPNTLPTRPSPPPPPLDGDLE
jgi:hypothetical protein